MHDKVPGSAQLITIDATEFMATYAGLHYGKETMKQNLSRFQMNQHKPKDLQKQTCTVPASEEN